MAGAVKEISTTGIDMGGLAGTITLLKYAALDNLVAQRSDRDTL